MMKEEPLHLTAQDAFRWVQNNTEDAVYQTLRDDFIRVSGRSVLVLSRNAHGIYFWARARQLN